jgi:Undecaprenyl-phosphate glucose phosphotransferase
VLGRLADRRVFTRNVVIVGTGEQAAVLLAHVEQVKQRFVSILGLFRIRDASETVDRVGKFPILGDFEDLPFYTRNNDVDDIIIALPWSADDQIASIVNALRELPMNVYLAPDVIGFRLALRPAPDHFADMSLVEIMGRPLAGWGALQKAALDYSLGFLLTILFTPLMLLIAIAIKLDSPGPVFFRQDRYGFVNKVFRIWKFRTMKHTEIAERETKQATRNDPRVTRVGKFLRRTSLDELPQLYNVLAGTMSLVGPRPHATDHNEAYAQVIRGYFARHRVKPGITGWAQVNGFRGETKQIDDMENRVTYDVYYTENWSLWFDLKILAMTPIAWLSRRNAY